MKRNDYNRAFEYYQKIILNNTPDAGIYINLGTIYRVNGDNNSAILMWMKALEADPNNYEVCRCLANLYIEEDNLDMALQFAETVINNIPDDPDANYITGVHCLETGNDEMAFRHFQIASEKGSIYPDVYSNLGALYEQKGENDLAVENYLIALELDPYHIPALEDWEISTKKTTELTNNRMFFKKVIEIDRENYVVVHKLGDIYTGLNQTDIAEDY
jgi:tetratricopeptide (TPR) repeat protein